MITAREASPIPDDIVAGREAGEVCRAGTSIAARGPSTTFDDSHQPAPAHATPTVTSGQRAEGSAEATPQAQRRVQMGMAAVDRRAVSHRVGVAGTKRDSPGSYQIFQVERAAGMTRAATILR